MILSCVGEGPPRRTRRAHNQLSEFIKGSGSSQPQRTDAVLPEPPSTPVISSKKRGKQKAAAAEVESPDLPSTGTVPAHTPLKRRKTITNPVPSTPAETISSTQPTLDPSESISAQSHNRNTRSSLRRAGPSTVALPTTSDPPPRPRRVILRVTQPESILDQFLRKSLEPFLSSFISLNGKKDVPLSKLEDRATKAAVLAEKRAEFRRKGWYLPLDRNGERKRGPPEEPVRVVKTWDVLLKAVEVAYRPDPLYLAVTKQICEGMRAKAELSLYGRVTQGRLVRGTTKTKGSKRQRDDPETAGRKKLAKETLELVVDQWKRIVLASIVLVI